MTYEAFVLTPESRAHVIDNFPPKYPEVIAHHVTYRFGVPKGESCLYGNIVSVRVIGYAVEDGIEALVVAVNGQDRRPDGRFYHITLSLDRNKGKKPQMSNEMIERGFIPYSDGISFSAKFSYI